ncbi:MAG: hypothetical protein AB7E80_00855 [Hyphomicrobiaceae bacterium]
MICRVRFAAGVAVLAAICSSKAADAAEEAPQPVEVARATAIPQCTVFVDAASRGGDGSADRPHATIGAAVRAAPAGSIICVAEGRYAEQIAPGAKNFSLAGGFQSGQRFRVRDSARFVSRAVGKGGSFLRIADEAPGKGKLTSIDGFDISGYSQAVVRDYWESQRFDLTNNFIHDNTCAGENLAGAGFSLANVSGTIRGNVIRNNSCARGGAGFLNDAVNENTVVVESNWIDANHGTSSDSHGGGFYLFGNTLRIAGNLFSGNTVTQWGGGLFVGAFAPGNQPTNAKLSRNVYRANRAGTSGGGFFCDDGAACTAEYELYDGNCGGNILVDGGASGSGPTVSRFDHVTIVNALSPGCKSPGIGFLMDTYQAVAPDNHVISNAIFWGNGAGQDIAANCGSGCAQLKLRVERSMVQTKYGDGTIRVVFGEGIVTPQDPMFVAPARGDYRLRPGSPVAGVRGSPLGAFAVAAVAEEGRSAPAASAAPVPAARTSGEGPTRRVVRAPTEPQVQPQPRPEPEGAVRNEPVSRAAGNPARDASLSPKEAFDFAKELNTTQGWNAFLKHYPEGFLAGLARAYVKQLDQRQ